MKQRIVVHGAENFIGQRLGATLAASDWAEPLPVKTLDAPALEQAIGAAQAVVHSVVGNARTIERSALALYGALARAAPQCRVVHLSSMTVYGSARGIVDEDSELRADLGSYSHAQREAEHTAAGHPNTVILRLGVEYGAGCPQWSERVARLLLARRLGDLGAAGDGCCNLLYIDDLISAVQCALRASQLEQRYFNLAEPAALTWNDYFIDFALALGAVPVRRIGAERLRMESTLLAPILKVAELSARAARLPIAHLPAPIAPAMLSVCRQEIRLAVGRAEQLLGMRWTARHQALEYTAAWCLKSLGLPPRPSATAEQIESRTPSR